MGFPLLSSSASRTYFHSSSLLLLAKPKQGRIVDSYRTVSVNCTTCRHRLFRYKKKNGTQSRLIKCMVERIVMDEEQDWLQKEEATADDYACPQCQTNFARAALIHGRPALKLVGGKTRMTKK